MRTHPLTLVAVRKDRRAEDCPPYQAPTVTVPAGSQPLMRVQVPTGSGPPDLAPVHTFAPSFVTKIVASTTIKDGWDCH